MKQLKLKRSPLYLSILGVAAVDALEEGALQNGQSDKDIVHVAGRVRYKF